MKIIVINNIEKENKYITLRPDNAVLRNNDDFYLPHFSKDIVCGCGIVVRITRLAKCIAPKFASRCYDSLTAGVAFVARDIMQQAVAEARPSDEAYCFDHSIAIGTEWIAPEQLGEGIVEMNIGNHKQSFSLSEFKCDIDSCVAFASDKLTLKTGDLVFISRAAEVPVTESDCVTVTLNNTQPLNFQIK